MQPESSQEYNPRKSYSSYLLLFFFKKERQCKIDGFLCSPGVYFLREMLIWILFEFWLQNIANVQGCVPRTFHEIVANMSDDINTKNQECYRKMFV